MTEVTERTPFSSIRTAREPNSRAFFILSRVAGEEKMKLMTWIIPWFAVMTLGYWLLYTAGLAAGDVELLNVSYDPTRELWRDLNEQFQKDYAGKTGKNVQVKQSHGGSSSQARSVIDGLNADVVTLALWNDIDVLRKNGLIKPGWETRFKQNSIPYYSTIVFVVRRDNPKDIHNWADLIRDGVKVITPNPKTSGNGRLSFLAAWGQEYLKNRSDAEARAYVAKLYRQVPVLDTGARGSTTTFAQKGIGDVHLTWENEAHLEIAEKPGEMEIVYPSSSIRAEPPVALVDANVDSKGTRNVATEYLKFVYTEQAQETVARHFYRPTMDKILKQHAKVFPDMVLFPVTSFVKDWQDAQDRFFANGAVFDSIYANMAR